MNLQDAIPDFTIIQGDDLTFTLTFKDEDGVVIDITGFTVFFTAKKDFDEVVDDADAPLSATVTSHTDPTNGITEINIPNTDTVDLEPRKYYYDIQIKDLANKISSAQYGVLEVLRDVTNRTT